MDSECKLLEDKKKGNLGCQYQPITINEQRINTIFLVSLALG